ncbi:putative transporter small subunit [Orrella marina]|nr:putative transporter small subunit [Orrella marina]
MSSFWITFYILIWPVISAGVLAVLLFSLVKDWLKARKSGRDMV